ncbi:hypothetical protein D3C76_675470 [compost metagenome]
MTSNPQKTSKICPQCGCDCMVALRSLNRKICPDCRSEVPWTLDEGQRAVVTTNRADRRGGA